MLDAATGALLNPLFGGGTKRMTRPGFLEMTDVRIMPPLLQMIFGETGAVLPMRLDRVTATTLTVDLVTQRVIVGELRLLMAPHDPPGLAATRDDVDSAVRRLHELSVDAGESAPDELAAPPDLAAGAAAPDKARPAPKNGPAARSGRWLGPLTSFLNLTSSHLLPRIHVSRLYMHHAHMQRGVPTRPFAIQAPLAEMVLMWMCMAYPGAGAAPGYVPDAVSPPRPWHNGAGGGARCPAAGEGAAGDKGETESSAEAEGSRPVEERQLAKTL
jgi:hypothetical protein